MALSSDGESSESEQELIRKLHQCNGDAKSGTTGTRSLLVRHETRWL